jgi:hypothetical protein
MSATTALKWPPKASKRAGEGIDMALLVKEGRTWQQVIKKASDAVRAGRSANPMDWLFDNPLGASDHFNFGVLKQSYRGYKNSACLFGYHKLNPVPVGRSSEGGSPAGFSSYKSGVVLPSDADDALDGEVDLLIAIEESACCHDPSLLLYLTLSFPGATRLHHCWRVSYAFADQAFAQKRQLPVVLVQHRPGAVGSGNPAHVHLLVGPRQLDGTGFRGYAHDILCDEGQQILFDEWTAFRATWASPS